MRPAMRCLGRRVNVAHGLRERIHAAGSDAISAAAVDAIVAPNAALVKVAMVREATQAVAMTAIPEAIKVVAMAVATPAMAVAVTIPAIAVEAKGISRGQPQR